MDLMKSEEYTVDDIYALPEGARAELIDGRWYDMAAPGSFHQAIVAVITADLVNHIKNKGGKCRVFPSPVAVFLNEDNRNYLEPDIIVVCDEEKINERGCNGAPDLVVEIVSPSSKKIDYGIKLFKYRMSGVREYWIINPDMKTINTYSFSKDEEEEEANQLGFDEELTSSVLPGFSIVLSEELM